MKSLPIIISPVHLGHLSAALQESITQSTSQFGWEHLLTCGYGFAKKALSEPGYYVLASAYIGVGHLSYSCYEFYNKLFQVPRPISARDQSFQYYSCHNQKRRVKTKIGIARTNDNDQQSAIFIKAIIINIILKLNKIKDYFIRKTLNNL